MLRWISDAYLELRAAFGNRWTVIGLIFSAIVARINWLDAKLIGLGVTQFIGIPDWVFGLIVVAFWAVAMVVINAVKLRRLITPDFAISFHPAGSGIVSAHENVYGRLAGTDQIIKISGPTPARYLRLQIDTLSRTSVSDCVVVIFALAKKLKSGGTFKGDLPQPIYVRDVPFKIYPGIPHTIDFLKTNENDNRLNLADDIAPKWPAILAGFFDDVATYRFTFKVSAGGTTKSKKIDIVWDGRWDTITGSEVPDEQSD